MIKSPILHHSEGVWDDYVTEGRYGWALCGAELREAFGVPKKATRIQLHAYKKPNPWRVKVKFLPGGFWSIKVDGVSTLLDSVTENHVRDLLDCRKIWYVECYYWVD